MAKRRRLDFSYDAVHYEASTSVDHLCALYPHERDKECHLVEKTHEYIVKGQLYQRTVSSVWAAFFEQFNAAEVSGACVAKAQYRGLVNAASSGYNWSAYETLLHQLPQDKLNNRLAELVKTCDGEEELRRAYEALRMSKPKGESCYYLMVHAGAGAQEIQDTWSCNGRGRSFQGYFVSYADWPSFAAAWRVRMVVWSATCTSLIVTRGIKGVSSFERCGRTLEGDVITGQTYRT